MKDLEEENATLCRGHQSLCFYELCEETDLYKDKKDGKSWSVNLIYLLLRTVLKFTKWQKRMFKGNKLMHGKNKLSF